MDQHTRASPVEAADRIESLDVLRGFAVLGILVMNIQSFSMPEAAYFNPTVWGDLTGINLVVWYVSHLFADTKFISIFSILFGAGVCLFADRAEARTGRSATVHYRRMGWLFAFGMVHAYLLWIGDILVPYALCGCLVYLMRRWRPRTLAITGVCLFAVSSAIYVFIGVAAPHIPPDVIAELRSEFWSPTPAQIAAELTAYRGLWLEQMPVRTEGALGMQLAGIPFYLFWRCAGALLIGMALYRWDVLSALYGDLFYRKLALIGIGVGAVPVVIGTWFDFYTGWTWPASQAYFGQLNYWGGLIMGLGYIGLVMLAVRRGWLSALQTRLAAAGRMAFTNYIAQTLICTTIFYGHGFGLFGRVDRWQQAIIVIAIWVIQLWWSPLLMRRFRYGPLEWSWRALTYWRIPGR